MGFFYFVNCIALAGGPHVIVYKALRMKDYDAFWRCFKIVILLGFVQLARMFLATLIHLNCNTLTSVGLLNYEACGVIVNFLAIRFAYSYLIGRGQLAILIGSIGWSFGDFIFTKVIPLWTGTRSLEFDWSYLELSLDSNFELMLNFVIFTTPWLIMRKENNIIAAFICILSYILASFHLSIFSAIDHAFVDFVPVLLVKFGFTFILGLSALFLKVTWTCDAPYDPKKTKNDDTSPAAIFTGFLCQIGTYCLQTLRNAVTVQASNGRKN